MLGKLYNITLTVIKLTTYLSLWKYGINNKFLNITLKNNKFRPNKIPSKTVKKFRWYMH
jgi:hypothetical protein